MIKSFRIAAVTLLAVGGLGVYAADASAAASRFGSAPIGALAHGSARFPAPPTGDSAEGASAGRALGGPADPISLGPLNVAVPAVGLL
ncbi:hypothetical protein [Streptomyces sp. NPDC053069]|uniref:hypothetical protein n=1 Tax=Streptomyces sp. NPDC053069 TaxID=3365695 RepID=UPI0037D07D9E